MRRHSNTWTVHFISPLTLWWFYYCDNFSEWYNAENTIFWSPKFLPFGGQKCKLILNLLGSQKGLVGNIYYLWYLIIFIINVYGMKLWRIGTENCISFSIGCKFILHSQTKRNQFEPWELTGNLKWLFVVYFYNIPSILLFRWWLCDMCPRHSLLKLYLGDNYEDRKRKR